MKYFNFNDFVYIKPTEEGFKILKDNYNKIMGDMAKIYKYEEPKVDENGYIEMQLWQVMQNFGEYMYNGNMNLPFESMIGIPEECLKDKKNNKSKKLKI